MCTLVTLQFIAINKQLAAKSNLSLLDSSNSKKKKKKKRIYFALEKAINYLIHNKVGQKWNEKWKFRNCFYFSLPCMKMRNLNVCMRIRNLSNNKKRGAYFLSLLILPPFVCLLACNNHEKCSVKHQRSGGEKGFFQK